jgi:hypothetical protein
VGDELVSGELDVPRPKSLQKACVDDSIFVSLRPTHDAGAVELRDCKSCPGGAYLREPVPLPSERCGVDALGRLSLPGPGVTPLDIQTVEDDGGSVPDGSDGAP